jgi:hypothetical protein
MSGQMSGLFSGAQSEAGQPGQMQMSGRVRVREIEQVRVVTFCAMDATTSRAVPRNLISFLLCKA